MKKIKMMGLSALVGVYFLIGTNLAMAQATTTKVTVKTKAGTCEKLKTGAEGLYDLLRNYVSGKKWLNDDCSAINTYNQLFSLNELIEDVCESESGFDESDFNSRTSSWSQNCTTSVIINNL